MKGITKKTTKKNVRKNSKSSAAKSNSSKNKNALKAESETEYVLEGESVWITVKGFSLYINKTDEGVSCSIYLLGKELEQSIVETFALDGETPNSLQG